MVQLPGHLPGATGLGAAETVTATPRESGEANAEASAARLVQQLTLDLFEGVPEWRLV